MTASIEQLQRALDATEGKTPKEVLDAFLPKDKKIGGFPLVPLTFGHALFLSQVDHPLSRGELEGWKPHETSLALYAFTRKSDVLRDEVADGTLENSLYSFIKGLDMGKIPRFTALLMAHYLNSIQTGVDMHDPKSNKAQKKTLLGGLWRALREFAESIIGRLTTLSTNSR